MAKVQFNLDNKKYIMEFLPDNQVKIIRLDDEDRFITVQYFPDTKVMDFMKYIKSLDFSIGKGKAFMRLEEKEI